MNARRRPNLTALVLTMSLVLLVMTFPARVWGAEYAQGDDVATTGEVEVTESVLGAPADAEATTDSAEGELLQDEPSSVVEDEQSEAVSGEEESVLDEAQPAVPVTADSIKVQSSDVAESVTSTTLSIADASMEVVPTQAYTGRAVQPTPQVTFAGTTLHMGTDYTLSYQNNLRVGKATVVASGIGAYEGSVSRTFRIAYDLSKAEVSLPKKSYTYTGKAIKPKPTVVCAGQQLVSGTNYSVAYAANTKVGTARITINALADATGSAKKTFKVKARSIAKAAVAKVAKQTYTGKVIKPKPKVTLGGRTLRRGRDYTLTYKNNKKPGTATIIVKGKGNYRGTRRTTFRIVKSSLPRGPKSAGALKVKGSKLVDKNGKAIQLRGVSTHGLAWYPGYVNNACFKQLRTKWHANVVRLALYTEEYGGYCAGGDQTELLNLVKKGVRLATKNDLYVIVDWHILQDGDPNIHVADAKRFFSKVSSTFEGNNNVIYEICNEPNGGTTWSQIKKYAKKVIPVIRKNDPDAVVLVGTPTWSQEIDKAAASPLKYSNVMYTMHFYAATHRDDLRNRLASEVKGGLPVFVSEFGICDASGNGSIDKASANSWVTTMKSLGVSWCMWSLCNKAESASILKSDCTATSGFRKSDLSTSGTWLLKALKGSLPAGSDASQTASASSGSSGGSSAESASTSKPVTFTSGSLKCKAVLTGSWPAANGKTCYQYDLTITNKGSACSSWSVAVPFNKSIAFDNGWNANFKAGSKKLTVRNVDYNGSLDKGVSVTGIGFQVTAGLGLAVNP